ncbi:hypothetical protein LUZ60_008974 [Juncus effusus]|nr:hypothetical protein LUZ60_008974 [Juncus effusus]
MAEISGTSGAWWVSKEEFSADEEEENAKKQQERRVVENGENNEEEEEEDEDVEERRLVRTSPLVDWFDLEALEVNGVDYRDIEFQEFNLGRLAFLTLQTFAVVFGDIGLGPLYTFDVMFSKYPIQDSQDVIGALSLVLYTLILIPLIKYVLIVLWANDDSEGGIFALYSLITRNANISLIPVQFPPDMKMSSFQLKVPTKELERAIKLKEKLESSPFLKKGVLVIALFGTAMVLADGVITPAVSVVSAVSGLKVGIPDLEPDKILMISVAFLVILFSVQKYATSKVGFAIGPCLFLWFLSLGLIGIFNLAKYGGTVFKAFDPVHIYYYFRRDWGRAWISFGVCVLAATGSEAIFADLCHFSVRSIQYTFIIFVLPCLVLGYLGQAAFLLENQSTSQQIFFSSIPSGTFWLVLIISLIAALIASRTMITATFSCVHKAISLGCFPRLKIVHTSRKFMGQIYIPFVNWFLMVFSALFLVFFGGINDLGVAYGIVEAGVMMMTTILVTLIMLLIWETNLTLVLTFLLLFLSLESLLFFSLLSNTANPAFLSLLLFSLLLLSTMLTWNYGSKLKYESETKQQLSLNLVRNLGCNLGTIRAPGVGILCSEVVKGIPAVFGQFINTLPAIQSIVVFVCIKYVAVPVVPQNERFLFQRVCPRNYHLFRCIARYGYKDVKKEHNKVFEKLLIEGLEKFIVREAQELSLQSDDDFDSEELLDASSSTILTAPNGSFYSLDVPLLSDYQIPFQNPNPNPNLNPSGSGSKNLDYAKNMELEKSFIRKGRESGVVYLMSNGGIRAKKESWFFRKLVLNYFYAFLRRNCRRGVTTVSIPHGNLLQVQTTYMV